MRIAYITAGAAGRLCGNCLRDNSLARSLNELGDEAYLIPTYTPIRTDDEDVSEDRVFFNGLRVYLEQKHAFFRKPRPILDRIVGARSLIGLVSRFAGGGTDPKLLGALTVSMLRGEMGNQSKELDELIRFLKEELRPDIVHLTNILLVGLARRIRAELGVPVVCGLQAEDAYLDYLPKKWRAQALDLIEERAAELDRLIAVSAYYADEASRRFRIRRDNIDVVLSGIDAESFLASKPHSGEALTIGYFARLSPDKGFERLCDAYIQLCASRPDRKIRLELAGFVASEWKSSIAAKRAEIERAGLGDRVVWHGTIDLAAKHSFFAGLDLFCVPTLRPEPKGLFVLEAMAAGVPVLAPSHGVFPELVEATQGGVLFEPNSVDELARQLGSLLEDEDHRQRLGTAGRQAVQRDFTTERMAIATRDVYRDVRSIQDRIE